MPDNQPEIVYLDNHLLVLNKPAGWLTQPNESLDSNLEEFGKQWIKQHFQKPGNVFLSAVHRLDKPVSGIVVLARTSKALSRLNEFFREGKVEKTYFSIVEGKVSEEEGVLESWIVHDSHQARIVKEHTAKAKQCLLKYRVLKIQKPYTLLQISLDTGRYHQIRAQFSSHGLPILGDKKYGGISWKLDQIALHHGEFKIPHPITKEELHWKVDISSDWPLR